MTTSWAGAAPTTSAVTVPDICKTYSITKQQLVSILARDETMMDLLAKECEPIFIHGIELETRRLIRDDSPFSIAGTSVDAYKWPPPTSTSSSSPERPSPASSSLGTTGAAGKQQELGLVNLDFPDIIRLLLNTLREKAPLLHEVLRTVTRYEANGRVGPMLGAVGALLRCRQQKCDALGKIVGVFGLSNAVPKEVLTLLSRFGYTVSYNVAHRFSRELEQKGKTDLFGRPALRRLEQFLVRFEAEHGDQASSPTPLPPPSKDSEDTLMDDPGIPPRGGAPPHGHPGYHQYPDPSWFGFPPDASPSAYSSLSRPPYPDRYWAEYGGFPPPTAHGYSHYAPGPPLPEYGPPWMYPHPHQQPQQQPSQAPGIVGPHPYSPRPPWRSYENTGAQRPPQGWDYGASGSAGTSRGPPSTLRGTSGDYGARSEAPPTTLGSSQHPPPQTAQARQEAHYPDKPEFPHHHLHSYPVHYPGVYVNPRHSYPPTATLHPHPPTATGFPSQYYGAHPPPSRYDTYNLTSGARYEPHYAPFYDNPTQSPQNASKSLDGGRGLGGARTPTDGSKAESL
ncbi:hypothetical protein BJ742DRAFT_822966 [Cladochytrium replicatum]|nr:hypothetical protein BJ742DRAFT_822966 [Cladochytrium replicatum]